MSSRLILFSVFFLFLLQKGFSQQIPLDTSRYQVLRIAPETAIGGDASLFLSEVNYIPLETSKESEFGSITQLEVTKLYFIILDQATDAVLLFKRNGDFHCRIQLKRFSGQMVSYGDQIKEISINQAKEQILIRTRHQNSIYVYDFNAKLLQTIKTNLIMGEFLSLDEDNIVFNSEGYRSNDDLKNFDQFWFKNPDLYGKSLINKPLKRLDGRDILSSSRSFYRSDLPSSYFRTSTYDYNIYRVSSKSIEIAYRFLFPLANSLPTDFLINPSLDFKRLKFLRDNNEIAYGISDFYKVGKNILFKLQRGKSSDFDNLIYNIESQNLIAFMKITPDPVSSYLTIAQPTILGVEFANNGIQQVKDGYLYTSYSALEIFNARNNTQPKVKYGEQLEKFFAKGNDHANPVLVEIKLKDEL